MEIILEGDVSDTQERCALNPTDCKDESISELISYIFNCTPMPNPTSDELILDFNILGMMAQYVELNLIDNTGKLVFPIANELFQPNNYIRKFDVRNLPVGTYFIEYKINKMRSATPITIVR